MMGNCPINLNCADMGLTDQDCLNYQTCITAASNNQPITVQNFYEEELASYDQILALQPNNVAAWNKRGRTLKNLERYEEAITSYKKALELDPDNLDSWISLCFVLEKSERYEEAVASSKKILELDPDNLDRWVSLCFVLEKSERYEEAVASYKKALELRPDSWVLWRLLDYLLMTLGRNEEALTSYKKFREFEPNHYRYWRVWKENGDSLMKLGREEEAVTYYNKAEAPQREIVLDVVARLPNQFKYTDVERACPTDIQPTIKRVLIELRKSSQIRCIKRGRDAVWEKIREKV